MNNLNQINHTAFRKIIYLKTEVSMFIIMVSFQQEVAWLQARVYCRLLNALFEFQNKKINNKDLAKESIYFEQRIL